MHSVAAVAGALAWTSVADDALAGTARPSARNLAQTNIEVRVGLGVGAGRGGKRSLSFFGKKQNLGFSGARVVGRGWHVRSLVIM